MALIGKSIPNLINGVSQQPPKVRLPSQCEEQVNMYSTVAKGLTRRAPTRHVAKLLGQQLAGSFVHIYSRDKYEKYIVLVTKGDVRVFDLNGQERTVHKPKGTKYLYCPSPSSDIKATTVADNTFILNRTQVVRTTKEGTNYSLQEVRKDYVRLSFEDLPSLRMVYTPEEGPVETKYSRYSLTIDGKVYEEETKNVTLTGFMSRVAANLSADLNRECVIEGLSLYVPLKAGENFSVQDNSYYWGMEASVPVTVRKAVTTEEAVNRLIGYADLSGTTPTAEPYFKEGLVFVRLGDYGSTYSVSVDDVQVASITTTTTDRNLIKTDYIAQQLFSQIVAANLPDIQVSIKGNVIRLRATSYTKDFTLSTTDSIGDRALNACKGRVQSFTDLPAVGFNGFTIKVAGDDGIEADDYYVQYFDRPDQDEKSSGTWREVRKNGLTTVLAAETMPHKLVSNADGTFTFTQIEWEPRGAGDEVSAPDPSFVNQTISDVFFYKNRLGFLAGENVIFSEDGNYFSFYPSTVVQSLDTHPVDFAVTNDSVSILRHAVPFNESLLLFADDTQFIVSPEGPLTRETVTADVTTRFDASLDAKPIGAGQNVFFAVKNGLSSGVREFYVNPDSDVKDAADVTAHCPTYIKGTVKRLAASSNEDAVIALTDYAPNQLYIYKYFWQGNEKLQSSWSRWTFNGDILGFEFIESSLALVVSYPDGVYLERLLFVNDDEHLMRQFAADCFLDRRAFVRAGDTLPWSTDDMVAMDKQGRVYEGSYLPNVIAAGKATKDIFIGVRYSSLYKFSQLVLMEEDSRVAPLVGRVQMRSMTVEYVETGYFKAGFQPPGREAFESVFSGRTVGDQNSQMGVVPIDTGRYRFPVLGDADEVTVWLSSDSHLPCCFLTAEWEALYHRYSKRI